MRLEEHQNPPIAAQPSRFQRGANLGRVMAVIVDHRHPSLDAADLKTPVDAGEGRQRLADRVRLLVQLERHPDRGRCVQHVVRTRRLHAEPPQVLRPEP